MDTGIGVELPAALRDLAVCTGSCFLLVPFDATVVDLTAFGFFGEGCRTGDWDWRWVDVRTERLLPTGVVSSLLTSPTVCVGGTGLSKGWV